MKEPRNHLAGDLKALRYLDALNAGDLEAVSALWEEASHDPELERMLAELDGAMFQEILGNPSSLPERLGATAPLGRLGRCGRQRWRPPVCWPFSPGHGATPRTRARTLQRARPGKRSHTNRPTSPTTSPRYSSARRDLDEAAMPRFVWPLENLLSASTPLDLLD